MPKSVHDVLDPYTQALLDRMAILPFVDMKQVKTQLDNRPQLHEYDVLAIGYTVGEAGATGTIVMHYPEPKAAQADLEARQQIAQFGLIQDIKPRTYSEAYFVLAKEATIEESQIIMQIKPVNNKPKRLFEMVLLMDMIFATCP